VPPARRAARLLADRSLSRLLKQDWPRSLEEWESAPTDPGRKSGDAASFVGMLYVLDTTIPSPTTSCSCSASSAREPVVYRNDALTVEQSSRSSRRGRAVARPAPGGAGILVSLVQALAASYRPGRLLGHQAIARAFALGWWRADRLMHGKTCECP